MAKHLKIVLMFCVLVTMGASFPFPESSTTVKFLVPSASPEASAFDDDDDAVIIEAGNSTSPVVDTTPQAFDVKDCLLPKVKGPCRAIIEQWFFNRVTKSCEPFQWSGCGGNNNRFSEKEFCTQHCATSTLTAPIKPSPSPSPSKKGVAEKCPKFEGCGPLKCGVSTDPDTGCEKCECHVGVQTDLRVNGTSKDVVTVVGSVSGNPDIPLPGSIPPVKSKPEEVCHLPETRGNCRAMITMWRYNPELKECVQFHFGGCDDNPNKFVSREKCTEFCRGQ